MHEPPLSNSSHKKHKCEKKRKHLLNPSPDFSQNELLSKLWLFNLIAVLNSAHLVQLLNTGDPPLTQNSLMQPQHTPFLAYGCVSCSWVFRTVPLMLILRKNPLNMYKILKMMTNSCNLFCLIFWLVAKVFSCVHYEFSIITSIVLQIIVESFRLLRRNNEIKINNYLTKQLT